MAAQWMALPDALVIPNYAVAEPSDRIDTVASGIAIMVIRITIEYSEPVYFET
jgi:hypothetical protein